MLCMTEGDISRASTRAAGKLINLRVYMQYCSPALLDAKVWPGHRSGGAMDLPKGVRATAGLTTSSWEQAEITLKKLWSGPPSGEALRDAPGAGPVVRWLSSRAPLWQPRVSPVQILSADMAPLIRPCWGGVQHATTRRTHNEEYTTMYRGLWGEKGKK